MKTLTYTAKCSRRTHANLAAFLEQQRQGASLTAYDQCKDLTALRQDDAFRQYHAGCQRSALNRLHKAFQSFFARLKAGKKPGFSRFKGRGRVRSFRVSEPVGQAMGADRQGRRQVAVPT